MSDEKVKKAKRAEDPFSRDIIDAGTGQVFSDRTLSSEDAAHVRGIAVEGESYLDRKGFTQERKDAFLSRPDVRKELDRLQGQFSDATAIMQRRAFLAGNVLAEMVPMALATIAKTLKGPNRENILDYPTPEQIETARDVLNRSGITAAQLADLDPQTLQIPASTVSPSELDSPKRYDITQVARRESVRRALDSIIRMTAENDDRLNKLEQKIERSERKKHKKKRRRDPLD